MSSIISSSTIDDVEMSDSESNFSWSSSDASNSDDDLDLEDVAPDDGDEVADDGDEAETLANYQEKLDNSIKECYEEILELYNDGYISDKLVEAMCAIPADPLFHFMCEKTPQELQSLCGRPIIPLEEFMDMAGRDKPGEPLQKPGSYVFVALPSKDSSSGYPVLYSDISASGETAKNPPRRTQRSKSEDSQWTSEFRL